MGKDPIVEEIHAIREQILRDFNDDLGLLMQHWREQEKGYPERVLSKDDVRSRKIARPSQEADHKDAA